MDVTPLIPKGQQVIQQYRAGGFRIAGRDYHGAVIVTPQRSVPWAASAEALSLSSFDALMPMARELDIVLLGTGARQLFIPPDLRVALKDRGVAVDVMDTGAACRTYNVLMAEGRRIAAALLPC